MMWMRRRIARLPHSMTMKTRLPSLLLVTLALANSGCVTPASNARLEKRLERRETHQGLMLDRMEIREESMRRRYQRMAAWEQENSREWFDAIMSDGVDDW